MVIVPGVTRATGLGFPELTGGLALLAGLSTAIALAVSGDGKGVVF